MDTHRNPSLNTRNTNSNNQEREEIPTMLEEVNLEDISIHFLCTYSTDPNWKQIISTCNDYDQTLAHIAVTLGYSRLLQHLFRWQIDLNAVDSMGLSALHYAYLFKQEECAKFLIHSGVDRFILDDLGRSPADLDPSLEAILRSNMIIHGGSSAEDAPPIEYNTEIPDEAGKLHAKHFLIQQWMKEGEDEKRGDVPLSRCQSQETSSPPALDSADERAGVVPYDDSSSLVVRTPEAHSTPVVKEEIDSEALVETATPTHLTHPPSPISEVSPQTQEASSHALSYPLSLSLSKSTVSTPAPSNSHLKSVYDTEIPDEAGKLYAKHLLIQQWMKEGEDEKRGDVPLSRCQSQETSSPPALDSADERAGVVPYDDSSSLVVRTPEAHSTPVVKEEIDSEALVETATPTHLTHPPSPISGVSPQTQEATSHALSYPLSLSLSKSTVSTPAPSNSHLKSVGVTNTLSAQGPMGLVIPQSHAQGPMGLVYPQSHAQRTMDLMSPQLLPPNQVSLYPHPPFR